MTILAGKTSATIDVSGIVDDAIVEANETVIVTLTSVTSGDPQITLDATPPTTATVTIADNDSATVSIANDATASETPTDNGQFTVSQTQASSTDTVVSYTVARHAPPAAAITRR